MNNSIFGQAQEAYENGDFAGALDLFHATLDDNTFPIQPGETGLLYHQIGNCLVKLKNYADAISYYTSATTDKDYASNGTVFYNLGMAYSFLNDFGNAVANFQIAVDDDSYQSKYKAYTAMGNALMKSGKSPEAGAVFRKAAMDPNNPDPTRALLNLGVCFMALGRPGDAVIAYESAFQFDVVPYIKNRLNANLGQAYVATGQMQKAIESFDAALSDKTYVLSDSASVDYQRAIAAVSKGNDNLDTEGNSNVLDNSGLDAGAVAGLAGGAAVAGAVAGAGVASAAEVGADQAVNAGANNFAGQAVSESEGVATEAVSNLSGLDVLNSEDAPIPGRDGYPDKTNQESVQPIDPSQDNQFSVQDADFDAWTKSTKDAAYNKNKKHNGVKIFLITLLIVVLLALGAGVFLFTQGYGIPTQEQVVSSYFANPVSERDKALYHDVTDDKAAQFSSMVSSTSNLEIHSVNRSMFESEVHASAKTSEGGTVHYKIKMVRYIVGWQIRLMELEFASQA